MKFALINGQRQEAQPNLSGECPACGHPMVAKCGKVKIWHWAHRGHRLCDPWWENESEWHRTWKGQFPDNWQEFVHHTENGEKHIADVKTDDGWVIEFQHSYIKPEERRSRDVFYKNLVWVVDGARRKRDGTQLVQAWTDGVSVDSASMVRKVFPSECKLVREWAGSDAPILFDLGEEQVLWWLHTKRPDGHAYLARFSRAKFIESNRGGGFNEQVKGFSNLVAQYELHLRNQGQPLRGFERHLARRARARGRL